MGQPHSDRERSIVAHVGRSIEVFNEVTAEGLKPEHFGDHRWRAIFSAIVDLRAAGVKELRALELKERLRDTAGAIEALGELKAVERATIDQTRGDALAVIEAANARALQDLLQRGLAVLGKPLPPSEAIRQVQAIMAGAVDVRPVSARAMEARRINDSLQRIFKAIADPASRARRITGLPIGIDGIDERTRGLQPGKVVVVAARPSGGKSALGTTIVSNLVQAAGARAGEFGGVLGSYMAPTLVYSLEMEKDETVKCMLWAHAGIPEERAMWGQPLTDEELARLMASGEALASVDLEVETRSKFRAAEMAADLRAWHRRRWPKGPPKDSHGNVRPHGLVVIDYLQLVDGDDERADTVRQLTQISGTLREVAKETGVCILILSQLGRDSEKEARWPSMSDLKGAGAIEQDAHTIILLHPLGRTEDAMAGKPWRGCVMAILAKVRGGRPGLVPLHFWGECRRFRSWDSKVDGTYDDLMPQVALPRARKPKADAAKPASPPQVPPATVWRESEQAGNVGGA